MIEKFRKWNTNNDNDNNNNDYDHHHHHNNRSDNNNNVGYNDDNNNDIRINDWVGFLSDVRRYNDTSAATSKLMQQLEQKHDWTLRLFMHKDLAGYLY